MSQLWTSKIDGWNSNHDKKLVKFKKVISQLSSRRTINDVYVKMSELRHESLTSLYNISATTEDKPNSINASEDNSLIQHQAGVTIVEDELTHKKQISINLDSVSDLEQGEIIQTDNFKIKITQEKSLDDNDESKLIKLKIILPRGSLQNSTVKNSKEDVANYATEGFKPEDFSVVSDNFVAFANTLIDAGSADFTTERLTCSSPIPNDGKIEENVNETLNNTVDIQYEKEAKLVDFINNNTSSEGLDLTSIESEKQFIRSSISLPSKIEIRDYANEFQNFSRLQKIICVDDLRNRDFCNRNLENLEYNTKFSFNPQNFMRHSIDNGDYKYLKCTESFTDEVYNDKLEIKLAQTKSKTNDSQLFMNYSINCPPIMGKNALLAKSNLRKQQNTNEKDCEIIEKLVKERFKDLLIHYRMRSMRRSLSKKNSNHETINHDKIKDNICSNNLNVNKEVPQILITPSSPNNLKIQEDATDDINYEDHDDEFEKYIESEFTASDAGFVSETSTGKINKSPEIVLSPSSSLNSCRSESFGEFIQSGLLDDTCSRLSGGVEYDSQEFLSQALGDDMDLSGTITNESFTEDSSTCVQHYNRRTTSEDHSIGTSEMSTLISDPISMYSTLTEVMRARFNSLSTINSSILEEEMDATTPVHVTQNIHNEELLARLIKDSAIQYQIIQQTTKALNWCKNTKEFESSIEQIEAEKILLTATCQREILLEEIRKIESEDYSKYNGHLGSVQLGNLKFPAKSNPHQSNEKKSKDYNQWFVCVAHCGTTLYATDAVLADFDGNVDFRTKYSFENLTPDFEISVSIYSIKVKANIRNYSHESKYHLNKNTKSTCPSPSKFLTFKRRRSSSRLSQITLKPSGFTLWGTTTLKLGDLSRNSTFQMKNVPLCSTLNGSFSCTFNSSLKVEERYSGFLNIGVQASGDFVSWNKRWCSLYNTELRYWNYPYEEEDCPPLEVLDLRSCANSWISVVDRSICARSKTLLLETKDSDDQVARHFLNADTVDDMKKWEKVLNSVVSSLWMWRCMKCHLVT